MNKVVELLIKNNKTISTMESCTGGALVNAITNIPGASEVLKFSAVTYSNEYKIKMGVDKNIIDIAEKETMEVINEIRDDKNADILMLLVLSFAKGIKFGANGNERKIA